MSVGFKTTTYDVIEIPDKLPEELPFVIDDCSLAFHLGFRNKVMWYMLKDIKAQYTIHKIPKKRRGFRVIHDPSDILKLMQQQFQTKFLLPLQKQQGDHVTAYRQGKSVVDAAKLHIPPCLICDEAPKGKTPKKHACPRKGAFIQMDLQDFFPRTSVSMVRNYFKHLGYSHYVAGLMAALITVRDIPNPRYGKKKGQHGLHVPEQFAGVPQGAPTSGDICNLVADWKLDGNIIQYLKIVGGRYGTKFVYSRYSDDLTLTCGAELTYRSKLRIIKEVTNIIEKSGYKVNKKKTHMTPGHYRRLMLGVVCNDKPNYSKDNYYRFRAIVHNCAVHGFESQVKPAKRKDVDDLIAWLRGNVNWAMQINADKGTRIKEELDLAIAAHRAEEKHEPV
jgi:hypothetical protein